MNIVRRLMDTFSFRGALRKALEVVLRNTSKTTENMCNDSHILTILPTDIGGAVREVHNLQRAQEERRREQAELWAQIEMMYHASQGEIRDQLLLLLNQFPEQERVRLGKARMLQNRAQTIFERMESATTRPVLPSMVEKQIIEQGVKIRAARDNAPTVRRAYMRRLYDLLAEIDPYLQKVGGDSLVVKSVILWAFLRPGSKTLFVGGNYYPVEKLRRYVESKRKAINIEFGRQISREEIQECFIFLQRGGLILTRRMDNSKLFCSLNQNENSVQSPWREIINVTNQKMREIKRLSDTVGS